ncbi:hypothetical protein ACM7Z2_16885 [Pseudomonas aeruginosa]
MFAKVVDLYRSTGRKPVVDGAFSYEGGYDKCLADKLEALKELPQHFGRFLEVETSPEKGCSFTFKLPSNEYGKFFPDIKTLLAGSTSINKGVFPENIYIVDLNWMFSEKNAPEPIANLKKVCRLVHLLSELAIGVDRETNRAFFNLFFALPQDGVKPPRTFLIATKVTPEMAEVRLNHLDLLEQILHPKNSSKPNLLERVMMFRLSIADVLDAAGDCGNPFMVVVQEWSKILSQYRINLQSYVHGFSFEKVRQEVARAELEYAKSLSEILGDIAGKLLALPVSVAGILLVYKSNDPLEVWVLSVGLVVVSFILLSTIKNQKLQVKRLQHSFTMAFEGFESRMNTYPKRIQELLAETATQLDVQVKSLNNTFEILGKVSWLPVLGVAVILASKLVLFFIG